MQNGQHLRVFNATPGACKIRRGKAFPGTQHGDERLFAIRVAVRHGATKKLLYQISPIEAAELLRTGVAAKINHGAVVKAVVLLSDHRREEVRGQLLHPRLIGDPWGAPIAIAASRIAAERIANIQGSHAHQEWLALIDKFGRKCLRCNVCCDDDPLTKDHVVPLSKGGMDFISNIQPLCRKCNSWKGNREIDFRQSVRAVA